MSKLKRKLNKSLAIFSTIAIVFTLVSTFQDNVSNVNADVVPVSASVDHIDFGLSFPGESREANFSVSYAKNSGESEYRITKKFKPRHDAVVPEGYEGTTSDYCQENYTDYERCYRNLCPYLDILSLEGEGDLKTSAFVSVLDLTDVWTIYFSVPAILGYVAQDHDGGIVSVNGEYGCDYVIEVEDGEPYCGDGDKGDDEECDDGNNEDGDGCSAQCTIEHTPEPYCGDGNQDNNEECDDGNNEDGDGCSAQCTIEHTPEPYCGDGNQDNNEECDDGNNEDGDGCSSECTIEEIPEPYCGDGNKDDGEECDDGNTVDDDGCSATCTIEEVGPYCGNGIKEAGEQCDGIDGIYGNYTCNSSCDLEGGGGGCVGAGCGCVGSSCGGPPPEYPNPTPKYPVLTIEKTNTLEFVNPGDLDIPYKVVVKNVGSKDALDVVVEDTLPDGFVFSDTLQKAREWTFDKLAVNDIITLNYTVNASEDLEPGDYINTASVYASNHEKIEDDADLEARAIEVLGAELIPTGFSTVEFVVLISILFTLLSSIIVLKRKNIS